MKFTYFKVVFFILAIFVFKIAIADSLRTNEINRGPSSLKVKIERSY